MYKLGASMRMSLRVVGDGVEVGSGDGVVVSGGVDQVDVGEIWRRKAGAGNDQGR